MYSLTHSFKRKFFCHKNLSKFLFIIVLTSLESAFSTAIHVNFDKERGHKKTTNDIVKTKVDLNSVSAVYKVESVANCKRIGKVKTSKIIELWQKKHACEIRVNSVVLPAFGRDISDHTNHHILNKCIVLIVQDSVNHLSIPHFISGYYPGVIQSNLLNNPIIPRLLDLMFPFR